MGQLSLQIWQFSYVILVLVISVKYSLSYESVDRAPVIGVLTLPCSQDKPDCGLVQNMNATTYLPASYVKFLEGGGAKVIPLLSDMKQERMREIISQINGILLTGGDAAFSSSDYYWNQIVNILLNVRQYHGDIPIWGTCLGFEAIVCNTAKDGVNIMNTNISANYIASTLKYTLNAMNSRIFNSTMDKEYSADVYIALEDNAITFNEHYNGFSANVFESDPYLFGNFSVLATSFDVNGFEFVALMESKSDLGLYLYGTQFHPEKAMYEFAKNVPKSLKSIYSNQYFAQFFVNECRIRNNNEMEADLFNNITIYNFNPYYTAVQSDNEYQEMYLFAASH